VSVVEDACYQWGYSYSEGNDIVEVQLNDGNDDRFFFSDDPIPQVNGDTIYWVDVYFKDGNGNCDFTSSNCITRSFYNSEGPPQLQIGNGDTNEFILYPNPSSGEVNIRIRGEFGGDYTLDIFTQMGQKVSSKSYLKEYWTLTGTANMENMAPGVYIFRFTNEAGEQQIFKIVRSN
jgi:hypothetical protein